MQSSKSFATAGSSSRTAASAERHGGSLGRRRQRQTKTEPQAPDADRSKQEALSDPANRTIDFVSREVAGWEIVDDKTDVDVTVAVLQQRHGEQLVFGHLQVF